MKRIAHITDIHLDEDFPIDNGVDSVNNWLCVLDSLQHQNVDEIVFTGDIGSTLSNKWFFDTLKDYMSKLKITLGNHDIFSEVSKYFKSKELVIESELCYFEEDNYYRYIYLDTSSDTITEQQFQWLKDHIYANKSIVIFMHHPVLGNNTKVDELFPLKHRDRLVKILKTLNKKVFIFCGHYHMDDFIIEDNIQQQITTAMSYQMEKSKDSIVINNTVFGYRIIEITKDKISSSLIKLSNDS